MTLARYLKTHRISFTDFARTLGVSDSTVLRWSRGHRTPTVSLAFAIERATGGVVLASEWGGSHGEESLPPRNGKRKPQSRRRAA
jgi:transcriptional regulator with XRE-family HTH domain